MIKGIAASGGIVVAKAFVVTEDKPTVPRRQISPDESKGEKDRLVAAREKTAAQLREIRDKLAKKAGEKEAAIFDAHLLLLEDPMLANSIAEAIDKGVNAEAAVSDAAKTFSDLFSAMEDEYMRERAADIRDVCTRLINNLMGVESGSLANLLKEEAVVFAHDLAPSDTAQMDRDKVKAFVTEIGGRTSHSAIMARSLEIPAVVGVGKLLAQVKTGDTVIVDGNSGLVIVNPDGKTLAKYKGLMEREARRREQLRMLRDLPAKTRDGQNFELAANIGTPKDIASALANGAQGIGLYRTEFLYMDRTELPTEDEQYQAYRQVLEAFGDLPVIIRTLDIGGDKDLPYFNMDKELNPFLGKRAIRLCLANPEMFKTQLRAIIRAGVHGNAWIMLPMVATVGEVRQTKILLKEVEAELEQRGLAFTRAYKLGIMIEVPAAAIQADQFAREVDFFSIGTNDLIQYTCAVDRMNSQVSYLYDPFNPAVLRLIEQVIKAGHQHDVFVGMCGEMAGEPLAAPLLVAMGLDEFSMSAASIPRVKEVIRSLDSERCRQVWAKVKEVDDGSQVRKLLVQEFGDLS